MAEERSGIKNSGLSAVVCAFTLLLICIMAFAIRLFSVVKYESVIHEFDPYFNLRVSQFLAKNGPYAMWNWFDDRTWYPLGRVIGGTVYPGLMLTAGTMWWILNSLHITIDIGTVCVFTSPIFSANCAWATFLLTKEVKGTGAGLTAAALIATVPSYISRSVAGSYDNEGIAIFALVFTFYLYVKTLNTGSLFWATANALAYFYMVCSWGGYTFIINLIPIHMLACLLAGKYSAHLYIAYAPFIIFGTLLAASVPVVGFNAVMTSEHFASVLVFAVLHVFALVAYLKRTLPPAALKAATAAILTIGAVGAAAFAFLLVGLVAASPTLGWSGRSLSLLDPTYAGKYIPIIASVSEHQPPTWPSYFMDLHVLILLIPAGIAACFMPLSVPSAFLILYGVVSVYFSGAMVRLMLVLAPAACILAGIGLSEGLHVFARSLKHGVVNMKEEIAKAGEEDEDEGAEGASKEVVKSGSKEGARDAAARASKKKSVKKRSWEKPWWTRSEGPIPFEMAAVGIALALLLMFFFVLHCVWASAEAYSAPSIVLASHNPDGSTHIFDDFREAYGWLRHNTDENTKVASWWDYGYQTTAMANRTVIVDNNTWNNTHIATVGMAMSSPEREAWKIFKSLDVEYVFVIFGGFVGYSGDDIAKFLWMVRIGGGVYPHIKEPDYLKHGSYRIDSGATSTMLNCLMYKLSYYRFADATMAPDGTSGYDRVRRTEIGKKNIKLRYFEEVFTTHHWMVRIYRLKDVPNRQKGARKKAAKAIGSPKKSNKLPKSASKRKSRIGGLRF